MRNAGYDYEERIGTEADGRRLLDHLAARYAHSDAAAWRARIAEGRVLLDGVPVAVETVVRRGQRLTWRRPPWDEPAAPAAFAVLFEDDDVLAVAKPAGLPTLPGGGFLEATLLGRLRTARPGSAPLHRLGRWTSGVVLCARTPLARRELARQWRAGGMRKRYRALAGGSPADDAFAIDAPIGPVPYPPLGTLHASDPAGKPARSRVLVVRRRDGEFLCDVEIDSGRPHQIRIHLAVAGHPLVGDPLYGPGGRPAEGCRALPGDPGYLLHATELEFVHPRGGRRVVVRAGLPRALRD